MIHWCNTRFTLPAIVAVVTLGLSLPSIAQETSTTTTTPKSATSVITIDTAEVIYVSGDDAVLKLPDGNLRLLSVYPTTPLMVDGKATKVSDLKPGTTLSHVQVNRRVESDVTTVTQINGTVTAKKGRILTLRLDDGTSKIYQVPHDATFNVNGRDVDYNGITTGSKISATVVKTEGLSTASSKAVAVGQTPPQSGTLLIER